MTAHLLPPPKRRKVIVILVLLALFSGTGIAITLFYLHALERQGIRFSFADPGGMVSVFSTPLNVQPSPELVAEGLVCKHLGTSQDVEQIVFLRKEKCVAQIEISATAADLELSGLSYVLYDEDGREVGRGPLRFSGRLKQGESQTGEIPDARISDARGVVIGR